MISADLKHTYDQVLIEKNPGCWTMGGTIPTRRCLYDHTWEIG